MVALRSQGNWRWEGPLGTPLIPGDTEWTGVPDHQKKNIQNQTKLCRTKELGGKTRVLVGVDLSSLGGGTEAQGSDCHIGTIVWVRGETFEAESEAADL